MSAPFTYLNQVEPQKIISRSAQSKIVPGSTQPYNDMKLDYNYGTPEKPIIGDFLTLLPEMSARYGIGEKAKENGPGIDYQIGFDLVDTPEIASVIASIGKIVDRSAELIDAQKEILGVENFTSNMLKSPIFYSKDKVTKKKLPGKNPTLYCKLFKYNNQGRVNESVFMNPRSEVLDWSLLKGNSMKAVPCIHWKSIYSSGGKVSLTFTLRSAVVTELTPGGASIDFTAVTQQYASQASQLDEQIAELTRRRDEMNKRATTQAPAPIVESLAPPAYQAPPQAEPASVQAPVYQGQPQPQMSAIQPQGYAQPTIPTYPAQPQPPVTSNLQDFLKTVPRV